MMKPVLALLMLLSSPLLAAEVHVMPGEGTFDRILVTAAFPALPRFFAEQLVSGGMLIAPVMTSETECRMLKLVKTGSRFDREDLFAVPYLPIVPQMAQAL